MLYLDIMYSKLYIRNYTFEIIHSKLYIRNYTFDVPDSEFVFHTLV